MARAPSRSTASVLLVETESRDLDAIARTLETYEVLRATSLNDALARIEDELPTVVLLDLDSMSDEAVERLEALRRDPRTSTIPLLFLIDDPPEPEQTSSLSQLTPFDYVLQPVPGEILRAKIELARELRAQARRADHQAARAAELELRLAAQREEVAEAETAREQLRLAASERQRDELLATLAHELRNPLAPVVTGLELLRMHGGSDPEVARTRAAMERQVHHLVRLVDDLLDASRISRGKIRLRCDWLDLRDLLRHAVEPWRTELQKRRHELTLELPDEPVLCHGDRVRLTQVVDNLLSNAIRHSGRDARIGVALTLDGGQAVLRVADDGPGIAPELADRVFDMFVQARRGNGLGLGLAIVQQIARFHGGTVRMSSEPRVGTTVEVRLPLNRSVRGHSLSTAQATSSAQQRPLRIVLVEDERDVRETMQALLETWGHTVVQAATGLDGVDTVLATRPEVVLMDIGLPDVDGHTAARRILDLMGSGAPKLVALTGFGQDTDRSRARDAGFDAHLVKPVAPETLRATLYEVVD